MDACRVGGLPMTVRNDYDYHSDFEAGQLPLFFRGGICAFGLGVDLRPLASPQFEKSFF